MCLISLSPSSLSHPFLIPFLLYFLLLVFLLLSGIEATLFDGWDLLLVVVTVFFNDDVRLKKSFFNRMNSEYEQRRWRLCDGGREVLAFMIMIG